MFREWFPVCPRYAYLNHAGVAPTSTRVRDAVSQWMTTFAAHGIVGESGWESDAARVRERVANLVEARPEEIAFVRNTSHGLGLVAEGIDWKAGDEVLVATSLEYPSNVYVWQHLASRGVRVREIPAEGGGVTASAVRRTLSSQTRLVAVSAVQYATGHRTDLAALGTLCRERGLLFCVDGIQQIGASPLSVKKLGIHFLAADSHKWMLGMPGIGFLFVDASVVRTIRPAIVGWKSTTDAWNFDRAHFELRDDALRFEEGSPSYPLVMGLGAAVDILSEAGLENIDRHIQDWLDALSEELVRLGCRVGPERSARASIACVEPPPGVDVMAVARACAAADVCVSVRRQRLRVSPHLYNDATDRARLVDVVRGFVR